MGTYTTNYNLFMPTIGEQGWGELVNGNFSTIDTTMKSLSNGIGTLETDTDARLTTLESGEFDSVNIGTLRFDSIVMPTLSYSGYSTITFGACWSGTERVLFPIYSSPFPISGIVSVKGRGTLYVICSDGLKNFNVTSTQTEFNITNAYSVFVYTDIGQSDLVITFGNPVLI